MRIEPPFKSKTAIVTGAGQGIGFEICRELALQGALVILNDQDPELAAAAAGRINKALHDLDGSGAAKTGTMGGCIGVGGDASDPAIIHAMVDLAVSKSGRLDIAIANAGITLFGEFLSYPAESFFKVMQVNLGGSFFLAQAAAKQMKEQGNGGSILFMSSVTGHQAHKNLAAYGMSKAALEMLAKSLVVELSSYHITVNAIAPGATLTERTAMDADYEKTWSKITPLGRPAATSDIANAALFLVSSQARHITGQSLIIDGGWTAVSPDPY